MYFTLTVDDEIELQLLEEDHAEGLFRLIEDCRDHLDPWFAWIRETTRIDDTRRLVREARSAWGANEAIHTAITYRGELCGGLGGNFTGNACDLAYWLHPDYEGDGIATRSCRALVDHAFSNYDIRRCVIRATPDNERSLAIPQRLGFTREGTLRKAGVHPDGPVDLEIHTLLRDEWESEADA